MKAMMQSVRRRFSSEARKATKDRETSTVRGLEKLDSEDFMENKELPRFRQQRRISKTVMTAQLPPLKEVKPDEIEQMFVRKVRLCTFVFPFVTDETEPDPFTVKEKDVKRQTLLELVDYITLNKPKLPEPVLEEVFCMLEENLFRPLPPTPLELGATPNPEEDEPTLEPSWPHLQIVYEFLVRIVSDGDPKVLKKWVNPEFVENLLELFDSEDPRERDYLKTILHKIYGRFMSLRPIIRKGINHVLWKFIYDTDRHNGIPEFLEILGSIINGFALPLKEEHKEFLRTVLLPLHKATNISLFHPQLAYCVGQFMEKDPSLAPRMVRAILHYWPVTSARKEILFLTELEEALDRIKPEFLEQVQVPLFRQIAKSMTSSHFQVAERAIYVLNNESMMNFISRHRTTLLPILFSALCRNTNSIALKALAMQAAQQAAQQAAAAGADDSDAAAAGGDASPAKVHRAIGDDALDNVLASLEPELQSAILQERKEQEDREARGHWNPTVAQLTTDVLKLFIELDPKLVADLYRRRERQRVNQRQKRVQRKVCWNTLEKTFSLSSVSVQTSATGVAVSRPRFQTADDSELSVSPKAAATGAMLAAAPALNGMTAQSAAHSATPGAVSVQYVSPNHHSSAASVLTPALPERSSSVDPALISSSSAGPVVDPPPIIVSDARGAATADL